MNKIKMKKKKELIKKIFDLCIELNIYYHKDYFEFRFNIDKLNFNQLINYYNNLLIQKNERLILRL